jgi:hypothetical protein
VLCVRLVPVRPPPRNEHQLNKRNDDRNEPNLSDRFGTVVLIALTLSIGALAILAILYH